MADTATPNLDLLYMQVGAPSREVVVNDGLIVLDTITSGVLTLDLSGAGDYTLTDTLQGEAKQGSLLLTGVLTGDRAVLVPDKPRQYLVHNGCTGAFTLTVKTVSGGGVTIGADTWAFLISDGTNVMATVTGGGGGTLPSASETQAGIVELATTAEVQTGTDTTRAVTPAGLSSRVAAETVSGLVELATTAEVTTGTDDLRAVTPFKLAQRLTAVLPPAATETVAGIAEVATTAEVTTGADDTRLVTPLKLAQRIAAIPAQPAASETVAGLVELATQAEVQALTDLTRALSPGRLASLTPVDTRLGLIELATQAEVTTGTDALRAVTPATLATRLAAIPAVPAASETVAGSAELATTAEVTTGADDARIVTPLKLQQKLTTAHSGTPLSVVRYAASGQALEPLPVTADLQVDRLGLGVAPPTMARLLFPATLEQKILFYGEGIAARYGIALASGDMQLHSASNGRVTLGAVSITDGTTYTPHITIISSSGNVGLWKTTFGTTAANVLALGSGTAPTTSVVDAVQLWAADTNGTALKAGLHLRTEDGTSHVLGDLVGLGTTTPAAQVHVATSINQCEVRFQRSGSVGWSSLWDNSTILDLRKVVSGAGVATLIDFNVVNDGASTATIRIFRSTTTTGARAMNFYHGDGTGTLDHSIVMGGGDCTFNRAGGLFGVATTLVATLGSGQNYQALNVNGSTLHVGASSVQERPMGLVYSTWVTSTDASRKSRVALYAYDATAAREGLRIDSSGTAPMIAFLGANAVLRQTVNAAATDLATVTALANSLRTALINFGLCV